MAENGKILIDKIIDIAVAEKASDIHFGAEKELAIRVNGEIRIIGHLGVISRESAQQMIFSLFSKLEKEKFLRERELDFTYRKNNRIACRCNAFFNRGDISISMRLIPDAPRNAWEIGLSEEILELLKAKQGLILICGPTGSGKTTTLSSMLDEINRTQPNHVVTLEDPIEFLHKNKRCIFSQRELHSDTHSFKNSLRAAMRQDPDVVVVGEMRDQETINAVLNLCVTGHLVFSTIHANSASQTIYRIAYSFEKSQRQAILSQLADSLLLIINQRLIPNKIGGRSAIFEIMLADWAVKNSIRNADISQLDNTIATSLKKGMLTMKKSAEKLVRQGIIENSVVAPYL